MASGTSTRSATSASSETSGSSGIIGGGGGGGSGSLPASQPTLQPQTQYHLVDISPQTLKLFQTNLEQAEKQGINVDRHNLIDDNCKDIITL